MDSNKRHKRKTTTKGSGNNSRKRPILEESSTYVTRQHSGRNESQARQETNGTAPQQPNQSRQAKNNKHKPRRQAKRKRNRPKKQATRPTSIPTVLDPWTQNSDSVNTNHQVLQWQSSLPHVSIQAEESLLPLLIMYGEKERGLMCTHENRYKEIARHCNQVGMQLSQALSLRRQHMSHLNPKLRGMPALRLGSEKDIRTCAALFESTVEAYLQQCNISFMTERQQRAAIPKGAKQGPTPDFLLPEPTLLRSAIPSNHGQEPVVNEYVIHWVEAKMFYGASTLAVESQSAVGRILTTADKYVSVYGTGAMVFMYGCGERMAELLLERGVVALDAHPLDLRRVEQHQQTWCANKNGLILP